MACNRDESFRRAAMERCRLLTGGKLGIAAQGIARLKEMVRAITKRNRGRSLERVVNELNSLIRGWVNYSRYAHAKGTMQQLDKWLCRKLRCCRLKQCKRAVGIVRFLMDRGLRPIRRGHWAEAERGGGVCR
ncbi:MAG: hypothetical protein JXR25_04980 [Pontiellaceae bacterium]|nr:hypothetical protein [Pontiellaceae bacterium]MBN2784161.1 hypothetical protein [Pontiellaceae bacterium]